MMSSPIHTTQISPNASKRSSRLRFSTQEWIPAYAGMTEDWRNDGQAAGMTEDCDGDNRFDRVRTLYQRGSSNVTVVPDAGVLTALTDPCMHEAACFTIARPSPAPPWARLWPGSAR